MLANILEGKISGTRKSIMFCKLIPSTIICMLDLKRVKKTGSELAYAAEDMLGRSSWFALPACAGASKSHPSGHQGQQRLVRQESGAQDCGFGLALLFPDEESHIMTIHVAGTK
jgi:hypothetical protein